MPPVERNAIALASRLLLAARFRHFDRALRRGAPRICCLRSRRDCDGNRAAQLRSRSSGALRGAAENSLRTRAAKNSDGQGPEICPSRQARDLEAVTGLTRPRSATARARNCVRILSKPGIRTVRGSLHRLVRYHLITGCGGRTSRTNCNIAAMRWTKIPAKNGQNRFSTAML